MALKLYYGIRALFESRRAGAHNEHAVNLHLPCISCGDNAIAPLGSIGACICATVCMLWFTTKLVILDNADGAGEMSKAADYCSTWRTQRLCWLGVDGAVMAGWSSDQRRDSKMSPWRLRARIVAGAG